MVEAFHYEIGWAASGRYPGHHRSASAGSGHEFRGHTPLASAPDARRIDLRASLKDPFGQWIVRTFRQRSAIDLHVIADLSASMGFHSAPLRTDGARRKLDVLADLTASAAYSAYRTGDAFGFIGADEVLRDELYLPATRAPGAGIALSARLQRLVPTGRSADALPQAAGLLPKRRSVVFLVSDYHLPRALLESTLDRLAAHHVIPVVLWDPVEFNPPVRFGISTVRDPETGRERTLLVRPALRRRLSAAFRERAEALCRLFATRGTRPLHITGPYRAEQVTRYFLGAHAPPPVAES